MGKSRLGEKPTVELPARLNLDLTTFEYIFNLVKDFLQAISNCAKAQQRTSDDSTHPTILDSGRWPWRSSFE
jgi:hypothetical protein